VKQWLETRQVLDRLAEWYAAGVPCALATVVRVQGSAYRHEGAKLVVAPLTDARGQRQRRMPRGGCARGGAARDSYGCRELREYCGERDEIEAWDLGVGCEGVVELCIEPVRDARDAERAMIAEERAHVVTTNLETGDRTCRLMDDLSLFDLSHGDEEAPALHGERFVELLYPPPRLLVVSAGDDAVHLARLAASVGFRVVVADRRPGLLSAERFPAPIHLVETDAARLGERVVLDADSFAVVMTHHFADDTDYLRALLRTPARYLACWGRVRGRSACSASCARRVRWRSRGSSGRWGWTSARTAPNRWR
jgi:xanthine dehydrogenase accessory factor